MFLDAFMFGQKRRLCFSPDDKVIDVYRAIYTGNMFEADCLEMEIFSMDLEKRYGIDVNKCWHDGITLGEIFELAHQTARHRDGTDADITE